MMQIINWHFQPFIASIIAKTSRKGPQREKMMTIEKNSEAETAIDGE